MKWVMSIALGLAIGYFVFQSAAGKKNGGIKVSGRLHRSIRDRKIAGVCGGIAEYLNMDSTIVRILFALLAMGWGSGILAYLACALIFPEGDARQDEEEEAQAYGNETQTYSEENRTEEEYPQETRSGREG